MNVRVSEGVDNWQRRERGRDGEGNTLGRSETVWVGQKAKADGDGRA